MTAERANMNTSTEKLPGSVTEGPHMSDEAGVTPRRPSQHLTDPVAILLRQFRVMDEVQARPAPERAPAAEIRRLRKAEDRELVGRLEEEL